MNDLISRKEAKKVLTKWFENFDDYRSLEVVIDNIPTACDIDNVVEEICNCDGCSSCCSCHEEQRMMECQEYSRVYEIVKKGGVANE